MFEAGYHHCLPLVTNPMTQHSPILSPWQSIQVTNRLIWCSCISGPSPWKTLRNGCNNPATNEQVKLCQSQWVLSTFLWVLVAFWARLFRCFDLYRLFQKSNTFIMLGHSFINFSAIILSSTHLVPQNWKGYWRPCHVKVVISASRCHARE